MCNTTQTTTYSGVYVDMDTPQGACDTLRVTDIWRMEHNEDQLNLLLRTSNYGECCFSIDLDKIGRPREFYEHWWQQSGDSLYVVLIARWRDDDNDEHKMLSCLLSIRVDPAAYGRWEFSEIPESRKKGPDDVLIASYKWFDIYASRPELRNNKFYEGCFFRLMCGDILSIIDDMVNWPLRARDITVMFTPFTRSNVTITFERHDYDDETRVDMLHTGYHPECFMPGVKIVSLTPTKIVLLGTRHCGIRLTNSLYSFTHEDHLELMNVEDIRTVLTKVTTRPPCPLFSLQKSTEDSKWFAVYENPTGDWLYQDVDVSDVTMDNYHVLSVGGNNHRVSLKPKTGGRVVRCTVDRTGKLVFY